MDIQTSEPQGTASAARIAALIFSRHRHDLISIARLNSSSLDDAEEALQDALMYFIESYEVGSDAPPLPWITLTLKRRCWAIAKRAATEGQRIRELGREPDVQPSIEALARPESVVELRELSLQRQRHLGRLKIDQQRALMLMGLGYSYKEISTVTGWTYTKVSRCIREGRAVLRTGGWRN